MKRMKSIRMVKSKQETSLSNLRSQESYNFNKIWRSYFETITKSRDSRRLIDIEHLNLAKLIFESLTNPSSNKVTLKSYSTFISSSIEYVYSCEKENWTLYIITFIVKINSMILKLCKKHMMQDGPVATKELIDRHILNSFDTLRTVSMIFKILSTSKDDTFCYSSEIFSITAYFCNKLMEMRPESMQNKFLGFFKTDPT